MLLLKHRHDSADEGKDGIELRKGGVDEGICHHAVPLALAYDTVCADLSLTDSGEQADEADCETDSEELSAHYREVRLEDDKPQEEAYESVKALCSRKSRENHIGR